MDHHVFLSYSSKDVAIMERVRAEFNQANLTVWTMRDIVPGTPSWKRAIERAIRNSGCVVGILTPAANASDWVREELEFAKLQQVPLFIILAKGKEKDVIPFGFTVFQVTDIRRNFSKINSLIAEIQKQLHLPASSKDEASSSPASPSLRESSKAARQSKTGNSASLPTGEIRLLVADVLLTLAQPYGEDVIEDVFVAVEGDAGWLRRYDELCEKRGKNVVNQMIGRYTKDISGYKYLRQVTSRRSKLTGSYSKLTP